jgi:hypothetical protein
MTDKKTLRNKINALNLEIKLNPRKIPVSAIKNIFCFRKTHKKINRQEIEQRLCIHVTNGVCARNAEENVKITPTKPTSFHLIYVNKDI